MKLNEHIIEIKENHESKCKSIKIKIEIKENHANQRNLCKYQRINEIN